MEIPIIDLEEGLEHVQSEIAKFMRIMEGSKESFNVEDYMMLYTYIIPLPSVDERKKIVEDVNIERRHALDTVLLRIMKCRNILDRQDLFMECVEQLSHMFKPDTEAVTNRIENLISQQFLEMDLKNPILVRYRDPSIL